MLSHQRQLLEAFRLLLPQRSKVLFLHSPHEDLELRSDTLQWLKTHGCETEEISDSKDLRFLNPAKEAYDGVWCGQSLIRYSIEDVQRVLASLFRALKPKAGAIALQYASQQEGTTPPQNCFQFPELGFASLLRQNGYQIQTQGRREDRDDQAQWIAVLAKRI